MKKKTKGHGGIRTVIVLSDTHVGCKLALCHPDGADQDDGGKYMPSKVQLKLWGLWEKFCDEWIPNVCQGEPFVLVHNGDVIDGSHHNSTTQWSHNILDQRRHAKKILAPIVAKSAEYYHIRGTSAHVGESSVHEEQLAEELGAIPNEEGQHARYELWLRLGGKLVHFMHHIGTTSSAQHETSAVNAEIAAMYADSGRFGREAPRVVVRSHRHRSSEIRLPAPGGYSISMVTPAWQLKTPYAWKISGARISAPQVGGSMIRISDEGELYTRHFVEDIGHSKEVVVGSAK